MATHLARGLKAAGCDIVAVSAPTQEHAAQLAAEVGAHIYNIEDFPQDLDLTVIAVKDGAVAEVAARLPRTDALVVHTSGSVPVDVPARYHRRAGVLYPLQTFSKDVDVELREVPFFLETVSEADMAPLKAVASMLSDHFYEADSDKRALLHIAGVLTSNFSVYLLEECRKVLARGGFPLEVVKPLAEATLAKVFEVGPYDAMTGPARRGDVAVVEKQAAALPPDSSEIYRLISGRILDIYHPSSLK